MFHKVFLRSGAAVPRSVPEVWGIFHKVFLRSGAAVPRSVPSDLYFILVLRCFVECNFDFSYF